MSNRDNSTDYDRQIDAAIARLNEMRGCKPNLVKLDRALTGLFEEASQVYAEDALTAFLAEAYPEAPNDAASKLRPHLNRDEVIQNRDRSRWIELDKIVCLAARDANIDLKSPAIDFDEEDNDRLLAAEDARLDSLETAYLNGKITRSEWARG